MRRDTRLIKDRILSYLEDSPDGTRQRRLIRYHFQNVKEFKQAYLDMIAQDIIKEQGTGKKNNPVLTVLCQFRHTTIESHVKAIRTTRQRIIDFLINTKDHAAPKRDIMKHLSYLKDFQETYEAMLKENIITEYGFGIKTRPWLVCLTFQYLQGLIK